MPPNHVIPVIIVRGIMGTNLRAKRKPGSGEKNNGKSDRNEKAAPGQPAWRPPNGPHEGWLASSDWGRMSAKDRQLLLEPATLEVDDSGPVFIPGSDDGYVLTESEVRQLGWGEVHADSYGALLYALQTRLNQTFGSEGQDKKRFIRKHWKDVMACDPRRWGLREFAPLTERQLEIHARHYFPIYSVGYNWLEDCEKSSQRLEKRIHSIIEYWTKIKRRCDKVILVTHSMGGLVARACAKRIPDKIAGVIHGVMPALGAPVAYRRIACGTEVSSPSNHPGENFKASRIAKILGETPAKTTPVLATSPGALELLPNHLYPHPWLHVRVMKSIGAPQAPKYGAKDGVVQRKQVVTDYLHLPNARTPNPYDLYRDLKSWYRLIDPSLVDPAQKYRETPGGVENAVKSAIATAENFHRALGDYYHPNTYAFYGDDQDEQSYSQVRWTARQEAGSPGALTPGNVTSAQLLGHTFDGQRRVLVEGKTELHFAPEGQDARGDGTVPFQSGAGVASKVKQAFATRGYDHQEAYKNDDMLLLTLHLIVKLVQEIS